MSIKSCTRTNQENSRHHTGLKTKKAVMALNMYFTKIKKRAESACEEAIITDGFVIEYLDIPTFIRRGVALSCFSYSGD